jgi:hypothetical protein
MVPIKGTYTETAECTGKMEIIPGNDAIPTMHFNMVVVSGGEEFLLIETDNNTLLGGTAQQ